jgi:hypothetical protein
MPKHIDTSQEKLVKLLMEAARLLNKWRPRGDLEMWRDEWLEDTNETLGAWGQAQVDADRKSLERAVVENFGTHRYETQYREQQDGEWVWWIVNPANGDQWHALKDNGPFAIEGWRFEEV